MANDGEVQIPVVVRGVYELLAIVQSRSLGLSGTDIHTYKREATFVEQVSSTIIVMHSIKQCNTLQTNKTLLQGPAEAGCPFHQLYFMHLTCGSQSKPS